MITDLDSVTPLVALDQLTDALGTGLALSPSGSAARRWLDLLMPAAVRQVQRGLDMMATGPDNPARRDMLARRMSPLADQLANAAYIEALRESAQLQKSEGRVEEFAIWTAHYLRWLGLSVTASCLLDDGRRGIAWDGPVTLFLGLHRQQWRFAADGELTMALGYLLLLSDAAVAISAPNFAVAALCCQQFAPQVGIAADFGLATPLVMDTTAGEGRRIVGWGGPSPVTPALCYGLDGAAMQARLAAERVRVGQTLAWLTDAANAADTLDLLVQVWQTRRGRCCSPAAQRLGPTPMACDFWRIRGLLAQKNERQLSNDPFVRLVKIVDLDESGISFLLGNGSTEMLVSGLIALNIDNRGWWLARPARVLAAENNQHFVAARWLGHEVDAVVLTLVNGDTQRALYLRATPSNGYQASVLLDHDWLLVDTPCETEVDGRTLSLSPEKAVQLGEGIWQYPCRIT